MFFLTGITSQPLPEQADEFFNAVFSKCKKKEDIEESIKNTPIWLKEFAEKIAQLISLGIYM